MSSRRLNHVMVPLFLLETVATGCLAVIFYYLKYLDNFKERRYPLPCADIQWISYPYLNDTSSLPLYLDDPALYSAGFFIPVATILLFEVINWFFYTGEKKPVTAACPGWTFHFFTRRIIRLIGTLLFGMLLTMVLTFTLKYMFAVPRPHFLRACQPNVTALTAACGGDIFSERLSPGATFTPSAATCLAGAHAVDAALRSFPSEHAALPAFCAAFLAAYLHRMTAFRRLVTARPALVFLALLAGVTPGVGSLHAFHVRAADLVAGYLLGAAIALYLTEATLRRFTEAPRRPVVPLTSPEQASVADGVGSVALSGLTAAEDMSPVRESRSPAAAIPRARQVNEVSNKALQEPISLGAFVNHTYNGEHIPPRRGY